MIVGFDLDGTLDRPAIRELALRLLETGNVVHVISGSFREAGQWQDREAKMSKLRSYGFPTESLRFHVEVLDAVDGEKFDREYRLIDIGLRKGDYCRRHGIEIMFDDSELYCKMMPAMCGTQIVHVR